MALETARKAMAGSKKKAKISKSSKSRRAKAAASRETLETYFREMLMIRRFEEKAGQMYGMGLIGGFCHLYIGQEAVVTGIQHALEPGDTVITGYRCHAHMLVAGADAKAVMAELTGRASGVSKGKGGSMHMFAPEGGFYGGHGIVGAQAPLGAGLGFAHKYRCNDRVSITYFGDGAANQGQVFETNNMASLRKLPIVIVVENNMYGMGTSVNRSSAGDSFAKRGDSFGIKNQVVNGMDVLEVRDAAIEAVDYCRSGKGPFILEIETSEFNPIISLSPKSDVLASTSTWPLLTTSKQPFV